MLPVPSSLIFAQGFDMMEAQATLVFQNLKYLRECVIFFDEFEEFFLTRGAEEPQTADAKDPAAEVANVKSFSSENQSAEGRAGQPDPSRSYQGRTIAAFTTSAMLPRLQELHDEARCLVFLATNYPNKLDTAITRPGRFDFYLEIDHPTPSRILQYLEAPTEQTLQLARTKIETDHDYRSATNNAHYKKAKSAVSNVVRKTKERAIAFNRIETALTEIFDNNQWSASALKLVAETSLKKTKPKQEPKKAPMPDDLPKLDVL
jgi:SpoVK/Ycf46/Vps4 family AAA+-type ATPase